MIRELFVFRHGETDYNREGRFQGHLDIQLNDTGREQARALIEPLRKHGIEAILSSDLGRAQETASIVAEALRVPIFTNFGLREAHLGVAQGMTREEIEQRLGAETVARWKSPHLTDADVSYEGGESGRDVAERVFAALEGFAREQRFQRIGVSTHGGVIRRIFQRLLPQGSEPVPIPNGVLYKLEYDVRSSRWRAFR